jgi:hypothetical protein
MVTDSDAEKETDRPVLWRGRSTGAENAPRKADISARAIEKRISFPLGTCAIFGQFVEKICLCGVAPLLGIRVVVKVTRQSAATVKGREEFR